MLTSSSSLNESPSEKEGKLDTIDRSRPASVCLNESPSEKEGKSGALNIYDPAALTPQ